MISSIQAAQAIARECPAMQLRAASRLLSRAFDEALRPLGLQSSQLSVLVAVAMFGEAGAVLGTLAERLLMDRTTLTRNLRPLERAGLLRVSRVPSDGRARAVTLTPAGERLLVTAYPRWERAQRNVRAALGAGRLDALRARLSEVNGLASRLQARRSPLVSRSSA